MIKLPQYQREKNHLQAEFLKEKKIKIFKNYFESYSKMIKNRLPNE